MKNYIAVILSLVCASSVVAQQNDSYGENPPAGSGAEAALGQVDPAESVSLASLQQENDQIAEYVIGLEKRIYNLEQSLRSYEERLQSLQARLSELSDGPSLAGRVVGALPNNDELRRQLETATQGKIVIRNYTGTEAPLYVNGTLWSARKGPSHIYSPTGRVAFQRTPTSDPTFKSDWIYEDGELVMTYEILD